MRRPPPAPAQYPAPPPRRTAVGPPPRRSTGRSRPDRASGARPTSVARRVLVLVAATLTILVVVGYGAHAKWDLLSGGSSAEPAAPADTGYVASVNRAIFIAGTVVDAGIRVRLTSDIEGFVTGTNDAIAALATERGNVQALTRTGTQVGLVTTTVQTLDRLEAAIERWRDVVGGLRLGQVADAKAEVEGAVTELLADTERWQSLTG